jgi:outer membrane lipoprotein SlyB
MTRAGTTLTRVTLAALIAATLAGCTTSDAESVDATPRHRAAWVQPLPGGGEVLCVFAKSGYAGGLTCDWDTATGGTP